MHEVDFANQSPVFEVSSVNTDNPAPSHGSSPSPYIRDSEHKVTTVPAIPEPLQHPQVKAAPQVIIYTTALTPEPTPAYTDPYTAPPSMISRGRQRNVSFKVKESMEAGEFKSSMFNAFQSTYETQYDLDPEIQYKIITPMAVLTEMQGDRM